MSGALHLVSEPTTPLSADALMDPTMDPFDRAILLCDKILSMLSGRVKHPEDVDADQKLEDDCNNSISILADAMPAKCSTLGLSANIGGVGAVHSSQQSEESDVDQELTDSCDKSTNSTDGVMPAKCSTLGFSPDVDDVEAVESSRQPGIVSTINPGLVDAPPPSTVQQLGILKPDEQAPTTCSKVVLGMGSDATRAKRDAKTMLVGLECTPTAAVVFPATMPPHPPDQPRLLLARPLPWPPWKVSSMLCMTHRTAGLLPVPTRPLDPTWKTIMSWSSVQSEQEQCHALWCLSPSICGQTKILREVKKVCTFPSTALPHISKCYACTLQGCRLGKVQFLPSDLENVQRPLLMASCTLSKTHNAWLLPIPSVSLVPSSTTATETTTSLLPVPYLERARDTRQYLACSPVIVLTDRGAHPCVLPGYNSCPDHSACILKDDGTVKAATSSYNFENLSMCAVQQIMILVALTNVEISRNVVFSATGYLFVWPSKLHYHVSAVNTWAHKGIFFWWQQQTACLAVDMINEPDRRFRDDRKVELHQEVLSNSFAVELTSYPAEQWTYLGHPVGIQGAMMLHIILLQQKLGVRFDPRTTPLASSSSDSIPFGSWRGADSFHDTTCFLWFFRLLIPLQSRGLVMLSVSVPWDPGACNELGTEELKSGPAQQQSGGLLTFVSPWGSLDCCLCAWAVYGNYLGKKHGAPHQYIALWPKFLFAYQKNGFILERISCWVMTIWLQANKFSEVQCIHQTTLRKLLVGQLMSFTWSTDSMLLLCQYRLYAVCSLWLELGITWRNSDISCKTSVIKLAGSAGIAEPVLLFDGYAAISPCRMLFILVHLHHFFMEDWIKTPTAMLWFWLLRGFVEQWNKLQPMQPIGVQRALLLHLLVPLQRKHGDWVSLGMILLPTAQLLLHCESDLEGWVFSLTITTPWNSGAQLRRTTSKVVMLHSILAFSARHQLNVRRLWDPGSASHRPAWGQAGFQGGENVITWTMRLDHSEGWAGLWAEGSGTFSYKRQTPRTETGGTEQITELYSP